MERKMRLIKKVEDVKKMEVPSLQTSIPHREQEKDKGSFIGSLIGCFLLFLFWISLSCMSASKS